MKERYTIELSRIEQKAIYKAAEILKEISPRKCEVCPWKNSDIKPRCYDCTDFDKVATRLERVSEIYFRALDKVYAKMAREAYEEVRQKYES